MEDRGAGSGGRRASKAKNNKNKPELHLTFPREGMSTTTSLAAHEAVSICLPLGSNRRGELVMETAVAANMERRSYRRMLDWMI
jgi:hypothetical protein